LDWFEGQTALVTGAAQGIGRGIAELLAGLGATVIAVDRDGEALNANLPGEPFVRIEGDLARPDTGTLAEEIWAEHGPVGLLVNNVGMGTPHRFLELEEPDFDRVFTTNLRGPWFFTKRIVERLVEAELSGSIVFVSSLHDTFVRTHPHYSASKAAVAMLAKELASELAPHGIRVNAVSPGAIESAGNPLDTPEDRASAGRLIPLGRAGAPADVARMVAVLLSDAWSGYVTGANVPVDGGLALYSWTRKARPAPPEPAPEPDGLLDRVRRLGRKPER
jgi:glucose 1-dehydrogenase